MKIIIVGASGAVGKTAIGALSQLHEIIRVGKSASDVQMDIENIGSIRVMYRQVGKPHPMMRAIGQVHFGAVDEMRSEQFMESINHKVLPQANLVLKGFDYVNVDGSFTVTSGVINRDPIRGVSCAAAANGALNDFIAGLRLICLAVFASTLSVLKYWNRAEKPTMVSFRFTYIYRTKRLDWTIARQ